MMPTAENTAARYSERDMHNERQALAAKVRSMKRVTQLTGPQAEAISNWNGALEAAAKMIEG